MTDPRASMPAELAQALHEYLMARPMREVEGLVVALRQAAPVEVEKSMPGPSDNSRSEKGS